MLLNITNKPEEISMQPAVGHHPAHVSRLEAQATRWQTVGMGVLVIAALFGMVACSDQQTSGAPPALSGQVPDGTVQMEEVQAAFMGSGGGGSGTLFFKGNSYPFTVAGLGVGGIGVSSISAEGEVYGLRDAAQFPGAYAQGRYGYALGNASAGDLWLENESNVIMHLTAKRTGLMLSLGGDAVIISMKQ
jgi:hypothetical protein